MSLNNLSPEQAQRAAAKSSSTSPDYAQLVQFLVEPFLESPESLRIDCEKVSAQGKTWVRLAFESEDRGRVYGRGGRNIQAIRVVLSAVATMAGESVYLDVYEEPQAKERPSVSSSRSTPNGRSSRTRRRSPAPERMARKNGNGHGR
ncbi:MAG: KH domain-containing protein [Microcoleaceae cyanobacterium]